MAGLVPPRRAARLVQGKGGQVDVVVGVVHERTVIKTGSGDLQIGASTGDLELTTGTGDINLDGVHGGEVRARTGTGDVTIAVAHGVAAYLDLNTVTGDVAIDLEETSGPGDAEAQARLIVHSGSGDIRVKRAQVSLA